MSSQSTDHKCETLNRQVAVVTGGGRGIGRGIAIRLAAAGVSVGVIARSAAELAQTVELIERPGGRALAFVADVTDASAIGTVMANIEHRFGPITLLVNNAARAIPIGPFCEADLSEWWRTFDINLRGPAVCTHAVLAGMISRQTGRIINIVTSAAPFPYLSSYATSKTALIRFTEIVAAETKPHGIAVFAVAPGTVRTAMSEYSLNSSEAQQWIPWFRRIFNEGLDVPVERPAQLVLELASGRADVFSGRFLSVSDDLDTLLKNVKQAEENHLYSLRVATLATTTENPALVSIRAEAERGFHAREE